jgi:DNA-binding NtrC family response regulator
MDLYYRLNTTTLHIPSLRERPGDILALSHHFLSKYASYNPHLRPALDTSAQRELMAYDWPGNVRELENTIQRALILSSGNSISRDVLELSRSPSSVIINRSGHDIGMKAEGSATLKKHERDIITQTLSQVLGNRTEAARRLGISAKTLRKKMRLYIEDS